MGNEGTASGWLYLNNGDSVFTRISRTNFAPNPTQGYGGVWADFDTDGWVDLFVARGGTYGFNHVLYQNNGAGALLGITNSLFKVRDYGISAAWSDYDGDGDLDQWSPLTTMTNLTGTLECRDPDAANHLRRFHRTVLK